MATFRERYQAMRAALKSTKDHNKALRNELFKVRAERDNLKAIIKKQTESKQTDASLLLSKHGTKLKEDFDKENKRLDVEAELASLREYKKTMQVDIDNLQERFENVVKHRDAVIAEKQELIAKSEGWNVRESIEIANRDKKIEELRITILKDNSKHAEKDRYLNALIIALENNKNS